MNHPTYVKLSRSHRIGDRLEETDKLCLVELCVEEEKDAQGAVFLAQMQECVPWSQFEAVVEPYSPKAGRRGGPPIGIMTMLRIYLMQQWFNLSDPMMEDALYEVESMRRFAGLELCEDRIPDESTILKFRHLLEKHTLTERLFAAVNARLQSRGLQVSKGTMVDATLIAASPSPKNTKGERDPEMPQTRKGNQGYFGMKIHAGADVDSGAAHTVTVTAANEADISQLPKLLRDSDEVIFGDAGDTSDSYKRGARALGLHLAVNDKRKADHGNLSASPRKRNRRQSQIRARVEHLFRIIKCPFGYHQVRYKGLDKNRTQVMCLMAMANPLLAARETGGMSTGQIRLKTGGMLTSEGIFGQNRLLERKKIARSVIRSVFLIQPKKNQLNLPLWSQRIDKMRNEHKKTFQSDSPKG